MVSLVSVNVGLPRSVDWRGRRVRTAIWKQPATGRVIARRFNLDGDKQGDLGAHGGEHRAILVYQLDSYRHWQQFLGRTPFEPGRFGENFTVEGLADDQVCIGDRYRIGTALFEVTQPRVTCYRVGIRLDEPRMPSLLVAHHRPGFYMRVLEEGEVGAGDAIEKTKAGSEGMTVAAVDALLYLPGPDAQERKRASRIAALSAGWKSSLKEPPAREAADRFRAVRVADARQETADVRSLVLIPSEGARTAAEPGQSLQLRFAPGQGRPVLLRTYSISGDGGGYRISVRRGKGEGSRYLHDQARVGESLEADCPQGAFTLTDRDAPLVLISAGIGVTPLLAMLQRLAGDGDKREIWWLHGARNSAEHVFAGEARALLDRLPRAHRIVTYSRPLEGDREGRDYDRKGHLAMAWLAEAGVPEGADVFVCGPAGLTAECTEALDGRDFALHTESFGAGFEGRTAMEPGKPPHLPEGQAGEGPAVFFKRSGLRVPWNARYGTLLELAEASNVPASWSCRVGVCGTCASGLLEGEATYETPPLRPPGGRGVLICCARPASALILDL